MEAGRQHLREGSWTGKVVLGSHPPVPTHSERRRCEPSGYPPAPPEQPRTKPPVPPRRWALTRPRLTRAPGLAPPRPGVLDPAQKLALHAATPHLALSHLSARAEGARRGEGALTLLLLTAERHMLPLPGQRPEGHFFFPPGGRKREGAGPAAAGTAAGVPAGCAASSGDGPKTTSPRLLRAAPAS